MSPYQAAQKYGLTYDEVLSIDNWFLQLPSSLSEISLNESIPYMSAKLGLSEEDTLELLQERLKSVNRSKFFMKIAKWIFFIFIFFMVSKCMGW